MAEGERQVAAATKIVRAEKRPRQSAIARLVPRRERRGRDMVRMAKRIGLGHQIGDRTADKVRSVVIPEDVESGLIDLFDQAGFADGHEITPAYRLLEQQNQPRDEVVHDGLQSKADTHRQRASNERQLGQIQADITQHHKRCNQKQHIPRDGRYRLTGMGFHGRGGQPVMLHAPGDPANERGQDHQQQRAQNELGRHDLHLAEGEPRPGQMLQRGKTLRRQAPDEQQRQRHQQPDRQMQQCRGQIHFPKRLALIHVEQVAQLFLPGPVNNCRSALPQNIDKHEITEVIVRIVDGPAHF